MNLGEDKFYTNIVDLVYNVKFQYLCACSNNQHNIHI
jgi:hypothetical protein